ncbi:MAG: type II secretion system F family protein [Desulfonatronovibrio sp.]
MPTYHYQALDRQGQKKKGLLESQSETVAFTQLQNQGLIPIQLRAVKDEVSSSRSRFMSLPYQGRKVRIEETFYYLGLMLQGGSSLAQSLDILGRMGRGKTSRIWLEIRDSVESGTSFSRSLARHPGIFPKEYIGMVQVAEKSGQLGRILEQIAGYEEHRRETRSKLLTALTYPLVVLLIGLGAVYFLLSRVLPRVAGIFSVSEQTLPLNTRILLTAGEWLENYSLFLLILFSAAIFGIWRSYKKLPRIRYKIDSALWRLPLIRDSILARFSGLLSFQLNAGISLVQAIHGAARGTRSAFFQEHMEKAARDVSAGQSLEKVLAGQQIFPQMYLTALRAGQNAGQLPVFLERISNILERGVDNTMRRIVSLAEPALILILGLVVGFFVLAVMGPIFDLTSKI